jgi:hypothetical protein
MRDGNTEAAKKMHVLLALFQRKRLIRHRVPEDVHALVANLAQASLFLPIPDA